MYNNYYIIDSHCHIYPEKIAAKAVGATDKFYGVTSHGKGTVKHLMERCKSEGVDHAIVQSVATTPKQVKSINEFIAVEVSNSNGFLTGLGTLHPDSENIAEDIEYLKSLGLKGVKLHPDIQQFEVDNKKLFKMYEICEKENLTMLVHTGDYRYDFSNPDRVINVLTNFPKLKFIGAHFGGWSVWEEASEKLSKFRNFYVDCSSSFGFSNKADFKEITLRYGTDKVLFGTDYPMWGLKDELETFFTLGFDDETNRKILSENAKKLFEI
ncbi:MAG: amidohydrolase [Clostridia bacterium]|nr:amidohydrolase [Clostridia bacterium]